MTACYRRRKQGLAPHRYRPMSDAAYAEVFAMGAEGIPISGHQVKLFRFKRRVEPFCEPVADFGQMHVSLIETPLAGCGKTYLFMKSLSAPCDKTGFFPLVLPLWGRLQRGKAGCGRSFSALC